MFALRPCVKSAAIRIDLVCAQPASCQGRGGRCTCRSTDHSNSCNTSSAAALLYIFSRSCLKLSRGIADPGGASLTVNVVPAGSPQWIVLLAAPTNQILSTGTYMFARTADIDLYGLELFMAPGSRRCNTSGRITIQEMPSSTLTSAAFVFGSHNASAVIAWMRAVAPLPFDTVVTGTGALLNRSDFDSLLQYLEHLKAEVAAGYKAGLSADQIQSAPTVRRISTGPARGRTERAHRCDLASRGRISKARPACNGFPEMASIVTRSTRAPREAGRLLGASVCESRSDDSVPSRK